LGRGVPKGPRKTGKRARGGSEKMASGSIELGKIGAVSTPNGMGKPRGPTEKGTEEQTDCKERAVRCWADKILHGRKSLLFEGNDNQLGEIEQD